jgi:hypothetical protein
VVTTLKNTVDKVVTEHGVAELRGRTVAARTAALIAVAHPSFRDRLTAEARRWRSSERPAAASVDAGRCAPRSGLRCHPGEAGRTALGEGGGALGGSGLAATSAAHRRLSAGSMAPEAAAASTSCLLACWVSAERSSASRRVKASSRSTAAAGSCTSSTRPIRSARSGPTSSAEYSRCFVAEGPSSRTARSMAKLG